MCYSAMIQADYEKYVRHYGATMSLEDFVMNVWSAPDRAKKKRRPKAMEDWFRTLADPKAGTPQGQPRATEAGCALRHPARDR